MRFIWDEDSVFLLERESFFIKMQHVKACYFICLQKRKAGSSLLFIEAKNSAPMQSQKLAEYLQQIHDKFCHSLFLYIGLLFNRHKEIRENLPDTMHHKNNLKKKIQCVLVVRQHKKEWLQPLQEALRKKIKPLRTAFVLQDVIVTNEQGAVRHDLIKEQ
jgi:gluconate kinase